MIACGHSSGKPGLWACILLGLLILCPLSLFAANSVLIVKSSDNRFFNTTIEYLIDNTQGKVQFSILSLQALKERDSPLAEAQLIVTLGLEAARYVTETETDASVIHSYLTEFQHNSHNPKPNHHSILLEQPLERYVNFIQHLLSVDHIGIVKPIHDPVSKPKLDKIQKQLAVNINQTLFRNGDNAVNLVRKLLQNNDVLLTLPAPEVYNRQSIKGILLATYRLKKPVISYSPAHVKSGALAAIYSSPEHIGRQLAQLVKRILFAKDYKPQPFYYPSEYDISINDRVARSLNLDLPDKDQLIKQLQQGGAQ